jgi:hypothetical protein
MTADTPDRIWLRWEPGAAVAVASENIRVLTPPPDLGAIKETGE